MSESDFTYLGSSEPNAPPCVWCKRRPQAAISMAGEVVFTGRCEPCAAAIALAAERYREERELRERQSGEMIARERDGKPKVATPSVVRFKRGDS